MSKSKPKGWVVRETIAAPPIETVEIPAGVFKNKCLALMDEVGAGHRQYVITKHGRPVAKLVKPDEQPSSGFGFMRGTVLGYDDIVGPDFEAWGEFGE